jgi:hypothetical protein
MQFNEMIRVQIGRLESRKTKHLASMRLGERTIQFGKESIQFGKDSAQWKEWNLHCEDVKQRGEKMVATAKQKLKRVSGLEATGEKGSKADPRWPRPLDRTARAD